MGIQKFWHTHYSHQLRSSFALLLSETPRICGDPVIPNFSITLYLLVRLALLRLASLSTGGHKLVAVSGLGASRLASYLASH